jgi:hypothetical protein
MTSRSKREGKTAAYLKTIDALSAEGGGHAAVERAIEMARAAARDALASGLEVGLSTRVYTLHIVSTCVYKLNAVDPELESDLAGFTTLEPMK